MRPASILAAALSLAATTSAQAVPVGIAPSSPPPEGCSESPEGNFTIGYVPVDQVAKKRATAAAVRPPPALYTVPATDTQQDANGALYLTLVDGVLTDGFNRTGSIVANHQFQFDGPPQAGAIYTGGFSVCANKSLALGGSARWWNCASGDFFNLYDENIAAQCVEIRILASFVDQPASSSSSPSSSSTAAPSNTQSDATSETVSASANSTSSVASSTHASSAASASLTAIPLTSINGTEPSGTISRDPTVHASSTPTPTTSGSSSIPDAPPSGGDAPSVRVGGATFGAVVGLLVAAMVL